MDGSASPSTCGTWCRLKRQPGVLILLAAVVALILVMVFCRHKKQPGEQSLVVYGGGLTPIVPKPHQGGGLAPIVPKPSQGSGHLLGADCASLPPANQPACLHEKLHAVTSGHCQQLQGCERQVCQDLFPNGVYPHPMTYANVPPAQRIIPPSFSKVYPQGYWPKLAAPLWGTECQTEPIGFYQGDLSEIPEGYVNVRQGGLPRFDPFNIPSEPYKTQWPMQQDQGFVGLHDWGMQVGNYTFSGQ